MIELNQLTNLPVLLFFNLDHEWAIEDAASIVQLTESFANALRAVGHSVEVVCLEDQDLQRLFIPYDPHEWLVFNWCEAIPGVPHSEALVAKSLEEMGFIFTGSDSQALKISGDKRLIKHALCRNNIVTPAWWSENGLNLDRWDCYPAIIKPAFEHCSLGISRNSVVESFAELLERSRQVEELFTQPVLIEEFIDGREFTVSVLGNGKLYATPIVEYDFSGLQDVHDHVRTYNTKHDPRSPFYDLKTIRLPASLDQAKAQTLTELAFAVFRAVNCRDYGRMDIREREGEFYVIDVNHNPDISPDASLPLAAAHQGISYGELGSMLLNLAARRHPLFSRSF
jgi:D-alanine-D-alanine ligase